MPICRKPVNPFTGHDRHQEPGRLLLLHSWLLKIIVLKYFSLPFTLFEPCWAVFIMNSKIHLTKNSLNEYFKSISHYFRVYSLSGWRNLSRNGFTTAPALWRHDWAFRRAKRHLTYYLGHPHRILSPLDAGSKRNLSQNRIAATMRLHSDDSFRPYIAFFQ